MILSVLVAALQVIAQVHNVDEGSAHVTDWELGSVEDLPENGVLDLAELGVRASLPMRVRVARNLQQFPLAGAMTKEQRCDLENFMLTAIEEMIAMPEYGGRYCSLTPGHANFVSDEEYQRLYQSRIAFHDLSSDAFASSAGIAGDWPHGRGVYISANKKLVIWVGAEDHLRIIAMSTGTVLNQVFDTLKQALAVIDAFDGINYLSSDDFGMVTSCPTNLGTGMRASVLIRLPTLTDTADGGVSDSAVRDICGPLGCAIHGAKGKDSPVGPDGIIELSPTARFCVTEAQIISRLYTAIKELQRKEDEARELKAEAERTSAQTDAQSTTKVGAWMSNKVPVSAKWKQRNFSARVFGIMVGVVIPFLIASPGLQMLASPGYFRGTGPSARLLIGLMLARNSTDLSVLYGPAFAPNSTQPKAIAATIDSMTDEELESLQAYMETRMAEECWNEESWLEHCQVRDGQPAEGPLSMAFGWPNTIDPDDLVTFEQQVARNETAEIPQQDSIFLMHFKNNPWAVVIGCIMFAFLYDLWFGVFLNGALDQQLQQVATLFEDVTDSVVDFAPFVTANRLAEAQKRKKAQRISKAIGMAVSLLLGVVSVFFLMMAIEGNQFGIKVMEQGQIVIAAGSELLADTNVDDTGGCQWVPNHEYAYGEELAGEVGSQKECIELVTRDFPEALIANMPMYGEGRCWAQFPDRVCNSCEWANDDFCDDGRYGGGQYCAEGTDEEDCIAEAGCAWPEDGVCDEIDVCPAGTDTVDCCDENGVKVWTADDLIYGRNRVIGERVSVHAVCPDPNRAPVPYVDPCKPRLETTRFPKGNLVWDDTQETAGYQSCLLSTVVDCDAEDANCPEVPERFNFGRLGRGFTSFCLGLLIGGGLLGAGWGHRFVPADKKDKDDYPLGSYRAWPIYGFFIVGIPYGLLTLTWAESLQSAQDHVMSAALSEDGTGILARASIKDGGWFDVQFAKLYREQGGGFRQQMVQTFAVAVISILWDIMVPAWATCIKQLQALNVTPISNNFV